MGKYENTHGAYSGCGDISSSGYLPYRTVQTNQPNLSNGAVIEGIQVAGNRAIATEAIILHGVVAVLGFRR